MLLPQFQFYASLVNYTIKLVIQKQITSQSKALEMLNDTFERKFFAMTTSSDGSETASPGNARLVFESRFDSRTMEKYRGALAPRPNEQNTGPVDWFVSQYFRDVIRTAFSEVARHRRLAVTVRTLRDKTPFFKLGRMVFSAPVVSITETACIIIAVHGEEIALPFDKRTRSRESAILTAIATRQQKYGRVRLKWHKEGYLDIDIRMKDAALK